MKPMSTLVIVLWIASVLGVGFGSGVIVHKVDSGKVAEAQAEVAALGETKAIVEAAVSTGIAEAKLTSLAIAESRAKMLCSEDPEKNKDNEACVAFLLCAQAVSGGAVQPTACDSIINTWLSGQWIGTLEEVTDPTQRAARQAILEKRK